MPPQVSYVMSSLADDVFFTPTAGAGAASVSPPTGLSTASRHGSVEKERDELRAQVAELQDRLNQRESQIMTHDNDLGQSRLDKEVVEQENQNLKQRLDELLAERDDRSRTLQEKQDTLKAPAIQV